MRPLLLVLLLATAAEARVIQPWQGGSGCESPKTVAALPGSPATGDFCTVTDGASASDCTTGSGSDAHICLYDGSAWVAIGGGSNTNAGTICDGATTYLNGEGLCDILDEVSDFSPSISSDNRMYISNLSNKMVATIIPSCENNITGAILEYDSVGRKFVCDADGIRFPVVGSPGGLAIGECEFSSADDALFCATSASGTGGAEICDDSGNCSGVYGVAGAGGNIVLDLGNDGVDESTAINEIATTNDTNNIFTESAADKLLIDVSLKWPTCDEADDLSSACSDCINETEIEDIYVLNTGDAVAGNLAVDGNVTIDAGHVLLLEGTTQDSNFQFIAAGDPSVNRVATFPDTRSGTVCLTSDTNGYADDLVCEDCINATEIEDIYLLNEGDIVTGALTVDVTSPNALTVDVNNGNNANVAEFACSGDGEDNGFCGVNWSVYNDASNPTFVAQMRGIILDETAASVDGKMGVLVKNAGTLTELQGWQSSAAGVMSVLVNPSNLDADFRVDGDTNDGLISVDAGNETVDLGAVTTINGTNEQHTLTLTETGSTAIANRDWLNIDVTLSPGATANGTTNNGVYSIIENTTAQNVGTVQAGKFETLVSGGSAGSVRALQGRLETSGSTSLGGYEGLQFNTVWGSTGNSQLGGYSSYNNFGWSGTGNIGVFTASVVSYNRLDLQNNTGTRSTGNVRIAEFDMHRFANATNTTINNMAGVWIDGDWGGPTMTNAYQLYLSSPDSGPSNTYAIYQLDNSNNATNLLDSATTFGDITHHNTKGSAPASCSIGDMYADDSGGLCYCTAADTWTNVSGVGNCS